MTVSFLALAFLGVYAQAQTLISAPVTVEEGDSFEVQVVLSTCADDVDENSMIFVGARVNPLRCSGSNQMFKCRYRLREVETASSVFTAQLPTSNQVSITAGVVPSGVFSHTGGVASTLVTVTWALDQPVVKGDILDPFNVRGSVSGELPVLSMTLSESSWTFDVQGVDGETLEIEARSDAAIGLSTGISTSRSDVYEVRIQVGTGEDCLVSAWSAFSACSQSCNFGEPGPSFLLSTGTKTRTRTILRAATNGGAPCPVLAETVACADNNNCEGTDTQASRPRSGEHFGMCQGSNPAQGEKCAPTDPVAGREREGCGCDSECTSRNDCCQAYFEHDCCPEGNCKTRFSGQVYQRIFPLTCSRLSDCQNVQTFSYISETTAPQTSYFCYCDEQCVSDRTCCGGNDARNTACQNAN